MKTTKNTYSLLVDSEEKGRSIFEGAIYALVLLSATFSAWQFASSSVALPRMPVTSNAPAPMVAKAVPQTPPLVADRG
jgi:hypothetical protein